MTREYDSRVKADWSYRIADRIGDPDERGCREYLGGFCKKNGYGRFPSRALSPKNGTVNAMVAAYSAFVGPIKDGMHIDHLCKNKRCVNPWHLEQVTPRVNCVERADSASGLNSRKTHCVSGHELNTENTWLRRRDGRVHRVCRECARRRTREWIKENKDV